MPSEVDVLMAHISLGDAIEEARAIAFRFDHGLTCRCSACQRGEVLRRCIAGYDAAYAALSGEAMSPDEEREQS